MGQSFIGQYRALVLVTAACSILLSAWCVWADPVVNNDGVYYFRAAREVFAGRWSEALSIYSWPFYPAFIAYFGKFTGADIVSSAYVLNALLYVVLVVGFLAVVYELGADRETLLVAAVLILLFPTLNKYRSFIIRDIGYLAFSLWSLVWLFRYWKSKHKPQIVGWVVLACVASLFRVEGIAMLVAVPIVIFTLERVYSGYRWSLLAVYALGALVLLLVLLLWLYRDRAVLDGNGGFASPADIASGIADFMQRMVGRKMELLKEHFAGRYYVIVYVLIIVFVALAEVVRRLAVVYLLLAWWGLKQNILFPKRQLKPLWLALIAVNGAILIGAAFFISIVVDRYTLTVSVIILLAVPFVMVHLWRQWRGREPGRVRWLFPLIVVACVAIGVKGLDVFTDKRFLYDAGRWIAANAPPGATLHSNNLILIYYSGTGNYNEYGYEWRYTHALIKQKKWKQFDYVAIELNSTDTPLIEWLDLHLHGPPVKQFRNSKGDRVLIYDTGARSGKRKSG